MKNQNGITLVALVITIIILVILAGISIGALQNQGLFTKTLEAKNSYDEGARNEQNQLNSYETEINKYMPNSSAE